MFSATSDVELGSIGLFSRGLDGTVADPEPHRDPPHKSKLAKPKKPKDQVKQPWREVLWFPDDPGFKTLIRSEWPDLLTSAFLLIIPLLLVKFARPPTPKYFPLDQAGVLVAPQYAYPMLDEYITTVVSAVLSFGVPFAVMGLIQIFLIGKFWDANSCMMGLSFALVAADIFQILIKIVIGGIRPHFYTACVPRPSRTDALGFRSMYFTPSICTGNKHEINYALMSFPSGHSTAAFAGFIFMALWINAKFKVCADYKSRLWQLVLLATPVLIAMLLSLSKIVDYWHHWYDVLVGACIGTFFAIIAYRMMYCSVFDWRYNHIPVPYLWEERVLSGQGLAPRRDLTAINFAGWQNKHTHRGDESDSRLEPTK